VKFDTLPLSYVKGVYESPITNADKFAKACKDSYNRIAYFREDATLNAIDNAADRLHSVSKICYWYGRLVYARVHYEFERALHNYIHREDGDQECRDFTLTQPSKSFARYRRICDDSWSDEALLNRIYLEASAKFLHNSGKYTSLFEMPKDSWMKSANIERILLNNREFLEVYLLYTEALRAWVIDGWVDRDTKVIIDNVITDKIFLNTIDPDKFRIVKNYIKAKGIEVVNWFGDARKQLKKLTKSESSRLFYINGAFYHSQRPELVNEIKKKSPNSVIIMVMVNLYEYGRQRNMDAHYAELRSLGINPHKFYGFENIKEAFIKRCEYPVKFYHYNSKGAQEKCLAVI